MPPSQDERRLRSLPARPLDELLEALAALQGRELRGEPVTVPRVTVFLTSGRELSGTVLQYTALRHGAVVLVRTGALSQYDVGWDASYVPLSAIEAVTVHDAASHAGALSPGGLSPSAEPPPTRLGARRAVESHHRELAARLRGEIAWSASIDEMPDGEPLRALVRCSHDVASALEAAGRDELGRTTILARIQRVRIEHGEAEHVGLEGDMLRVTGPFLKGEAPRRSIEELRAAIERLI